MKILGIVIYLLLLNGCIENKPVSVSTSKIPPKTIINEKCEGIPAVKIFQVLDNFSLAHACKISEYDRDLVCYGHTIYVPKEKNNIYYDDQIIEPPKGMCISYSDTYRYKTSDGRIATVPKLKYVNNEIKNPNYIKYIEEQKNI